MNNHLSTEQQQELQQLADVQKKKQAARNAAALPKSMSQIIEQQKRRGLRPADNRIHLCCQGDARDLLMHGLVYLLGERAKWLPEYDEITEWLTDNDGRGLMCIGDCGRGKTIITQRILPLLFERGRIRSAKGQKLIYNTHTALDLLDHFQEIAYGTLICIDDVGTEPRMKKFGVTHDYFSELVDLCERHEKLLVCSTNLSGEELQERYGLRTFDRLTSLTRRVFFEGQSQRI